MFMMVHEFRETVSTFSMFSTVIVYFDCYCLYSQLTNPFVSHSIFSSYI